MVILKKSKKVYFLNFSQPRERVELSSVAVNVARARTHVDDDVERVVVGQKDADAAAVLHGFVVVEVQSVHLRVARGNRNNRPPPTCRRGAPSPLMTAGRRYLCFSCGPARTHQRLGARRAKRRSRGGAWAAAVSRWGETCQRRQSL